MKIVFPVRLTSDCLVVDSKNQTVAILTWKGDLDHVRRQEEIGVKIVKLLNEDFTNSLQVSSGSSTKPLWRDIVNSKKGTENGKKEKV